MILQVVQQRCPSICDPNPKAPGDGDGGVTSSTGPSKGASWNDQRASDPSDPTPKFARLQWIGQKRMVTNSVELSKNAETNLDLNDLNHIRSWISLIAVEDGSVDWLKAIFRTPESLVIYHREWSGSCKFGYHHLGYVIITVVMCSRL